YPIELNDQPAIVGRHNSASEFGEMIVDSFDETLRRSEEAAIVFCVSLHSFVMGQPFRVARLRQALKHVLQQRDKVWLTVPNEISLYYRSLSPGLQLHAD